MESRYVVRKDRRYVRISPGVLYESHVQAIVAEHIPALFPGYQGIRYEPLIRTFTGDVRPDIVMLNAKKKRWALVEVEIDNHSFPAHVLPQMGKLAKCDDGLSWVDDFAAKLRSGLELSTIREIFSASPSAVLVTHGASAEYEVQLDRLGIECIDFDIFQAVEGPADYLLEVFDRQNSLRNLGIEANRMQGLGSAYWRLSARISDLFAEGVRPIVHWAGFTAQWKILPFGGEECLVCPSEISLSPSPANLAVFVDDETDEIHLK